LAGLYNPCAAGYADGRAIEGDLLLSVTVFNATGQR
jgi:hypothetical protein